MVAVSAYMGGTRGSDILSSACDVLEMSVVRGVGGVCGMCWARGGVGGVGGEWVTGLVLGLTNSGGTWGKWGLCFGCSGVGGRLGPGSGRVLWCYVWILCVDGRSRYLYIVLGGYLHILGAPSVQCCTLSISAS